MSSDTVFRPTALFWLLALATAAAPALGACTKDEAPPPAPVIRPVRFVQVIGDEGGRVRTFSGSSRAGAQARLSFKVPGTVKALKVKVGDEVNEGDLIAVLDNKDYKLQVEEATAGLAQARAQRRNAKAQYTRVRALYENRNASKSDLDAARAGSESARAAVSAVAKRLQMAKSQVEYCQLKAPTDGTIAAVTVEVNENAGVGQPVVSLASGKKPEVRVGVPGVLRAKIKPKDPVTVRFDALADKTFAAAVTEVGVATGQAATFAVTVQLAEDDPHIVQDLAAEVSFTFEAATRGKRFLVPPVAVGEDRTGRFVYVVEPLANEKGFGVTHRRAVEVGQLSNDGLEVTAGLGDGDRVVTAGVGRIKDEQKVRLPGAEKQDKQEPAPTAPQGDGADKDKDEDKDKEKPAAGGGEATPPEDATKPGAKEAGAEGAGK